MYPKSETINQTTCLESLVGIRSICEQETDYPFWLEDLEGVDVTALAKLSKASNLSGKKFGEQLINSAAREMLADIEMMLNNGFKVKETVGDVCSSCTILPAYTANTGIIIKSTVASRYQRLQITKLIVLTNVTGSKEFIIDDGVTPKPYTADFEAGVLMPINLNYSTSEKSVKIYFSDVTVPLGQISCAKQTSCGCGGSATAGVPIQVKGLSAGLEVSTQYGFLPCTAITCSYDALVCNMIKQTPNTFGLTLLYKVGEKYVINKENSLRNNAEASYNEQEKSEVVRSFGRLYATKMYGVSDRSSLKRIVNDYLRNVRTDQCVICDSKVRTAGVTG
jgi:hypothetical protein